MASKVFIVNTVVRWTFRWLLLSSLHCPVCLKSYTEHMWHKIREKQQNYIHYAKQEIRFSERVNEESQSKCLSQNDWKDGGSINRTEIEGSRKGTELGEDIFRNQLWTLWTGSARRASAWKCGKGVWGKAVMGPLMGGELKRERSVQTDKIKPVQSWSEGTKQTHG